MTWERTLAASPYHLFSRYLSRQREQSRRIPRSEHPRQAILLSKFLPVIARNWERRPASANLLAVTQVLAYLRYNGIKLLEVLGGSKVMLEVPYLNEIVMEKSRATAHRYILVFLEVWRRSA